MFTWEDMDFWQSGEWQVIQERLDDLDKEAKKLGTQVYNPKKEDLFAALDAVEFSKVRVCIVGQDPYPKSKHATGIAFSIPKGKGPFPPTLTTIFQEYQDDLHLPSPEHGDLTAWCKQGVLLWNSTPSCLVGQPGSHSDWTEWTYLTSEIIQRLNNDTCPVFVFIGSRARAYSRYVFDSEVIEVGHPSPMGRFATTPFLGSRVFTKINDALCKIGDDPINWRL